jgi:hypothetical protein
MIILYKILFNYTLCLYTKWLHGATSAWAKILAMQSRAGFYWYLSLKPGWNSGLKLLNQPFDDVYSKMATTLKNKNCLENLIK